MQHIFIIDYRSVIRFGIRYLLNNSVKDFRLHEFGSFREINSSMDLPRPNLIFTGSDSELKGIHILPTAQQNFNDRRFVIYDIDAKTNECIQYLRSGAHGYLSNKRGLGSLDHCIKTVMAGKFCIDPRDLHTMPEGLVHDIAASGGRSYVRRLTLSPRQNEIAVCLQWVRVHP